MALQADIGFDPASLSSGTPPLGVAVSNEVLATSQPASGMRRVLIYSLNNTLCVFYSHFLTIAAISVWLAPSLGALRNRSDVKLGYHG